MPIRKKDPPWLETIAVSPDLIYRYQVTVRDLEDILQADLNTLKEINQVKITNQHHHGLSLLLVEPISAFKVSFGNCTEIILSTFLNI